MSCREFLINYGGGVLQSQQSASSLEQAVQFFVEEYKANYGCWPADVHMRVRKVGDEEWQDASYKLVVSTSVRVKVV